MRRLKGPGRPLQRAGRSVAQLLRCARDSVDEVVVFDEDTPVTVLHTAPSALFVKGADYGADELPEAGGWPAWGGQAVTVPYLPGYSTTRLVEEVVSRATR